MNTNRMFRIAALLALGGGICNADWRDDMWERNVSLQKGVTLRAIALNEPRLMKAYLARIDLATPGIGFTATERAADWGKPMPDYHKKAILIDTMRETSADFMMRRRREGKNVGIVVNTSPWGPWVHPYNHRYGTFHNWTVSDGVELSHNKPPRTGAFFAVYKDGGVDITPSIPAARTNDVLISMYGFGMIMTNGIPAYDRVAKTESLAPRTALGITADRKTLVVLAIDGRQPGYSLGASYRDLFDILKREGVSEAVNMDGGGSTSLVTYDRANARPLMLNHQPSGIERKVALNLGITFAEENENLPENRVAAILHSYEFMPVNDTPPPKGFKPFYVSHMSRHGSRRLAGKSALDARRMMKEAESAGALTDRGRELFAAVCKIAAAHDEMVGELTIRGAEEQRILARRMFKRFPAVFAGRRRVRCRSTIYTRVMMSQANFSMALKELAPRLDFDFITGKRYQRLLTPTDFAKDRDSRNDALDRELDEFAKEIVPAEKIVLRFFKTLDAVKRPLKFAKCLFACAANCQCMRSELGGMDMFAFLEPDEIAAISRLMETDMYARMANSEEFGDYALNETRTLLADFIDRADNAIADRRTAADLRFGHDSGLWPLAGLIGIEGPGDRVPMRESYRLCPVWKWMSMASNVQMVFYGNDAGEVLVKILWNEREMSIRGLAPRDGPYYGWNDLRTLMEKKLK